MDVDNQSWKNRTSNEDVNMKSVNTLKKICVGIFAISCFSSCQSTSEIKTNNTAASNKVFDRAQPQEIDYQSIQRLLNLDRGIAQLGYGERVFNTCKVGFGYSATDNCSNKYFVVIHFKLMCRNSEGTISNRVLEDELIPVANQNLRWIIKNTTGELRTDSEGYGQVNMVASQSQRTERFRVSSSNDFLLMRAGDIQRLIVPSNWCE